LLTIYVLNSIILVQEFLKGGKYNIVPNYLEIFNQRVHLVCRLSDGKL